MTETIIIPDKLNLSAYKPEGREIKAVPVRFRTVQGKEYHPPPEIWHKMSEGGFFIFHFNNPDPDKLIISSPWLICKPPIDGNVDIWGLRLHPPGAGAFHEAAYQKGDPVWRWDGCHNFPTLEASIGFGEGCSLWHGYLENGLWRACE